MRQQVVFRDDAQFFQSLCTTRTDAFDIHNVIGEFKFCFAHNLILENYSAAICSGVVIGSSRIVSEGVVTRR